ncbi:lysozyme inhibitor LprI family protein [Comamonadaceae bacterium PP-2]
MALGLACRRALRWGAGVGVLCLAGLPLLPANAQAPVRPAATACTDAATQSALNRCAVDAHRAADQELNRLYQDMRARLKGQSSALMRLSRTQKSWLVFRDAECGFAASGVAGGSAEPMVTAQCLARLTQSRNAGFKAYLACPEGDLSCPLPPAR